MKTKVLTFVSQKHKSLFSFGVLALTLQKYVSLNGNARKVIKNKFTAHSKIYRLVKNKRLLIDFHNLVKMSGLVTRKSLVNIDFSSFCGFETLGFAIQTQMGRAIPIWADCLVYPIKFVGSQNLFILKNIKALKNALGFYPRFVLDRGFMLPILIEFFLKEKVIFYLRIKKGKKFVWVDVNGNPTKLFAYEIGKKVKDTYVWLYGTKLRLVISDNPKTSNEPWYILTTDFKSKRKQVLKVYRQRFEIEETFKDLKHLFDIKNLRIFKKLTFLILLWFQIISFWLSYWCFKAKSKLTGLTSKAKVHKKKLCSFVRTWFEDLQRETKKDLTHPILNST